MASRNEIVAAEKIIKDHILRPYDYEFHTDAWRDQPEIPAPSELMPKEDKTDFFVEPEPWNTYQQEPVYNKDLPHNIVKGPWPSKEEYIAAHYQILREDAIASLRASVKSFRRNPEMYDDKFTHVYTDIHFKGLLLSSLGAAFRIEFSHHRARKQIRWEQSSRLQQGMMVVLSPHRDMFRSICKVAIVAARPIEGGLDHNPPQVDIFWGNNDEAVFDPVEPYVMLESRQGYFEASRHMLVALQKLRGESFRLSKHLAELDNDIGAPDWLEEQRLLDLTSLICEEVDPITSKPVHIPAEEELALYNADVLQGFPKIPSSGMDDSQMSACQRMVTKKVSIVQGPPGTGKTFTSVSALRVLIENLGAESPPIIISAQTNHALDQLMNHILSFEPNVLRLGGRSDKENVEIQKRTLYTLRMTAAKDIPTGSRDMKQAFLALDNRIAEIETSMAPLIFEEIISAETLHRHDLITDDQKDSLYEEGWVNGNNSNNKAIPTPPLIQWLGPDNLIQNPRAPMINLGFPVEESDLEYEQLQQVELENEDLSDEKETDGLRGKWIAFCRGWTGRCPAGVEDRKVKKLLSSTKSLYDIPIGMRGPIYRYWEKKLNKIMLEKLKSNLKEYKFAVDNIRIAKWVSNFKLIRHLGIKIIGCTTTGLSKYRGLLASLQPRTLLIEEAAETLEGTIMAGMIESLEQLILVGDHQQLQASATIRELEAAPYNLSISMFERLVNNSLSYTMLNKQRRMIPDIRKLLCIEPKPFYSNLQDHPSVLDRKSNRVPVPGMGGKDTYFFHHSWPEGKNADQSRYNTDEAEMIAGFYNHLVMNGTDFSKITVLTFYNGQRKAILKELKRHPSLGGNTYFNVFTVDSYQGEENDVIILSLVRSNEYMGIGFLENKNRLVVALSRARRGLYIFGNTITLTVGETQGDRDNQIIREPLWGPVIRYMKDHGRFDFEGGLPITCTNHGKTIRVDEAAQWLMLAGGCDQKCPGKLRCGHSCLHLCHPFGHSRVICAEACTKELECGHGCSNNCGQECYCAEPACVALQDLILGNRGEPSQYDMPIAGGGIFGSLTKYGQPRNKNSRGGGARSSKSPKKGIFASQDIRNDTRREFSGPTLKRYASTGNGGPEYCFGAQRNIFSSVASNFSNWALIKQWNDWDPKKADREAIEEHERRKAESPQVDPRTVAIKDTFRAVKIQGGVRVKDPASSSQIIIPGVDPSLLTAVDPQSALHVAPPKRIPFQTVGAISQTLQAALTENDPFTLPTDPLTAVVLQKPANSPKKPLSAKNFIPSMTQAAPKTATQAKSSTPPSIRATPQIAAPANAFASSTARAPSKPIPSTTDVARVKSASPPKGPTSKVTAPPKSALPSKEFAPPVHLGSKAALGHPQALQQKQLEIEAMKKKIAETEAAKAAKAAKERVRIEKTLSGASRKLAPPPRATNSSNTVATSISRLNIADQPSLLDIDDNVMIGQDRMSFSFADLLGLEVRPSPPDPYGNADDFDQFEKQFL